MPRKSSKTAPTEPDPASGQTVDAIKDLATGETVPVTVLERRGGLLLVTGYHKQPAWISAKRIVERT